MCHILGQVAIHYSIPCTLGEKSKTYAQLEHQQHMKATDGSYEAQAAITLAAAQAGDNLTLAPEPA
jgi:hypothetical protein